MESPQQEKPKSHEGLLNPSHIHGLNGLRALAIILVLMRHMLHLYAQTSENAAFLDGWSTFFLNGWIGVDLFFVLSGYLISRPFFKGDAKQPSLKSYALKRALRIVPAYYFVMLLILIGFFPFYQIPDQNLGWRTFYHLIFMQDYLGPDINTVFWSLGVEEKFYFLMPLIVLALPLIKNDKAKLAMFILPILIAPLLRYISFEAAGGSTEYYDFFRAVRSPFHACLEPLFFGVLIAWLSCKKICPFPPKLTFWCCATALLLLMLSHEMLGQIGYYDVIIQPFLIACIMAGLVYSVVFGVELKILQNRITDFFSKISYSLYLLHWPLFPLAYIAASVIFESYALGAFGSFLIFAIIYCALSVTAATIQYSLIEKPFLTLKSRIK